MATGAASTFFIVSPYGPGAERPARNVAWRSQTPPLNASARMTGQAEPRPPPDLVMMVDIMIATSVSSPASRP